MSTTVEKVCVFWWYGMGEDSELVERSEGLSERGTVYTRITEANVFLV